MTLWIGILKTQKGKPIEKVREIREVIESKVTELVTNLTQTNQVNT